MKFWLERTMKKEPKLTIISCFVLVAVSCSNSNKQANIGKPKIVTKWVPRNVLASCVNWGDWDMDIYDNTTVLVYEQAEAEGQSLAVKQYKQNDPKVVVYTDKDRTQTDSTVRADIFISPGANQRYVVTVLPADENVVITGEKEFKGKGNDHFVTTFTSSQVGLLGIKVRVGFYNQTGEYVKK